MKRRNEDDDEEEGGGGGVTGVQTTCIQFPTRSSCHYMGHIDSYLFSPELNLLFAHVIALAHARLSGTEHPNLAQASACAGIAVCQLPPSAALAQASLAQASLAQASLAQASGLIPMRCLASHSTSSPSVFVISSSSQAVGFR